MIYFIPLEPFRAVRQPLAHEVAASVLDERFQPWLNGAGFAQGQHSPRYILQPVHPPVVAWSRGARSLRRLDTPRQTTPATGGSPRVAVTDDSVTVDPSAAAV